MRSYFRGLDPILARLLDAGDQKSSRHEDLSFITYLVEKLAGLIRTGGQGLSKACHATEVEKSPHPALQRTGEKPIDPG